MQKKVIFIFSRKKGDFRAFFCVPGVLYSFFQYLGKITLYLMELCNICLILKAKFSKDINLLELVP